MKNWLPRLAAATLVLAACRHGASSGASVAPAPSGEQTGAASPRGAVEGLLGAFRAQDLQGISAYFGNRTGPARNRLSREELEKREFVMIGCFYHDRAAIVGDSPGDNEERRFQVELARGSFARATTFNVVRADDGRYYVDNADINAVSDFCRQGAPARR